MIDLDYRAQLNSEGYWEIPDGLDTSNFDFTWRPDIYDRPYIHQFGTQWQKTGGPRFIVPEDEGVKYHSFQHAIKLPDRENRSWRPLLPNAMIDYSWHPDETEPPFIYVFGNQWYDSASMPTITYRVKGAQLRKYITDVKATLEVVMDDIVCNDNMVDVVKNHIPQSIFTCYRDNIEVDMNLLKSVVDDRMYIHLIDNAIAIIPKEANSYLYDKMADYPYIKYHNLGYKNKPLDIIFLSNGEAIADENYEHLLNITKDKPNRVVRIDGVNGRVASQHAAANASETAWYFLVNGKLEVNPDFDFAWQPDRFILNRKHYIFNATNPVNGLEYGHMAIVANNKNVTLDTVVRGLDFTMDGEIEVINTNSGTARYNSSIWDTWRTAFRECIKLAYATDADSKKRLDIWTTIANGEFGEYSILGAKDAIHYCESVESNLEKLMLSYDWAWLHDRFVKQYGQ